jgi:hypothetical protein
MGRASREKRERKELPSKFDFGPQFLTREPEVRIGVGLAHADSAVTGASEETDDGLD